MTADSAGVLLGVDFTCAPTRRKPITVARGLVEGGTLHLQAVESLASLEAFDTLLQRPGPWAAAFDFPFGLPRAFVDALALGSTTAEVITELHRRCPRRMDLRALIDAWGNRQPPGLRLRHRRVDTATPGIVSSSPLQTRYVPVGFMYYEGLSRLLRAGVTVPRMHAGDPSRVALEGYPGLLAFELAGRRSYKNADQPDRRLAREQIVARLEAGQTRLGVALATAPALRASLLDDASGDRLDAVLCCVQAAWAAGRPGWGLPADFDPVEGWITGAAAAATPPPGAAL